MFARVAFVLLLLSTNSWCGNSVTSLSYFSLGSTIQQITEAGFKLDQVKAEDVFKISTYETMADGVPFSLIFHNGRLRTITMTIENSTFEDYLTSQKDFTLNFLRRPDVDTRVEGLPILRTVWKHSIGTYFMIQYDYESESAYLQLSMMLD